MSYVLQHLPGQEKNLELKVQKERVDRDSTLELQIV